MKTMQQQSGRSSARRVVWALASALYMFLFESTPLRAQTSPATLPDLKLSAAGAVYAIDVDDGGRIYIGGNFVSVNDVPRTNLARLNPNGTVDLSWNAHLAPGGAVMSLVVDRTNVYLGGTFAVLDDPSYRAGLARVSGASGYTDTNWGPLDLFSDAPGITAIAVNGNDVYVCGTFYSLDNPSVHDLAKLSATGVGAFDTNWNPNPSASVWRLVAGGSNLFVAGDFTSIGGTNRSYLAKLLPSGRADSGWDAMVTRPLVTDFRWGLAVNSTNLYISGFFTNIGGVLVGGLAKLSTLNAQVDTNWNGARAFGGTFAGGGPIALLNDALFVADAVFSSPGPPPAVAKVNAYGLGEVDTNWNATFSGPYVRTLRPTPSGLLAGGGFALSDNAVSLSLARLDLLSGARDPVFNAQVQDPGIVYAIAKQQDGQIIVGGNFWLAGGLPRQHLARLNQDGTLDRFWSPAADGTVYAVAVDGTNVFVGGSFHKVGALNRTNLAKLAIQGSDAPDPGWDARMDDTFGLSGVSALAISGTNLFAAGAFSYVGGTNRANLAKLSTSSGDADSQWQADTSGNVNSLALSDTNLFIGGEFSAVKGVNRTNIAKLSASGSGAVATWDASIAETGTAFGSGRVDALALAGTSLFVGGYFTNIGGVARNGLAKVGTEGAGQVSADWNPLTNVTPGFGVTALALDDAGTNLYAGGDFFIPNFQEALVKVSAAAAGTLDTSFSPLPAYAGTPYALLTAGRDLYVGGQFSEIGSADRFGFAFLPVAHAPQLIQDTPTNLFIFPNGADGPEITHFQITNVSVGALYLSDGVTPVNPGNFITLAQGAAGLKFAPAGTITAVSTLNNTPAGAGTAAASLTMITNPTPVFKFSAPTYSVIEGQQTYIVIAVRKYGSGAGTVNYATSDITAVGGIDYQTVSGTNSFSAADKFKNIVIAIAYDLQPEGDKQFAITLTNASAGASIAGPATAVVTILEEANVGSAVPLTTTVLPPPPPDSSGALTVFLQPTSASGQWRLLGELNWHDSGDTLRGLVTGNYGIEFRPVNGYFQPQPVTVPISAGMTNQFTASYATNASPFTGGLTVLIQPGDVATNSDLNQRGQWRRQGGSTNWLNSSDIISNLNAGSYTVEFKSVANRLAPPAQLIQVGPNAIYGGIGTYFFASAPSAELPVVLDFGPATTNEPYMYNGQIQTSVGFGSGFVVQSRVVLTAAHVLFDDLSLAYTTLARWFFERYRDQLEPVPQIPRGWYVFDGYAAQRQLDNSPDISTPESQDLDAAAMFFLEDAGRGGYGGYLASDADANEYLLSANNKLLVGYPLDGVTNTDQGKLFVTPAQPENLTFTRLYTSIFATTNIASFPGNSGGPLYVQTDVNKYFPAAIYLGGSGETLVRAINSDVVDLINRAQLSGNGGANTVGGGVTLLAPGITATPFGTGLLTVSLTPSNALNVLPGWRVANAGFSDYVTDPSVKAALVGGSDYVIEFAAVPGFITPTNRLIHMDVGGMVTVEADYVPIRPLLSFNYTGGLSLNGATGAIYRVEYATNLSTATSWTPLTTQTLVNPSLSVSNTRPAAVGRRFYRAVLVP